MTQKRVFLLQCPHIAAVGGKVAGVQLAERGIQEMPPPFRPAFDQAQMVGVKRHRRKSSCDRSSSSAVGSVQTYRPAGALGSFGANGQPYFLGAVSRFKCGLQHRSEEHTSELQSQR